LAKGGEALAKEGKTVAKEAQPDPDRVADFAQDGKNVR